MCVIMKKMLTALFILALAIVFTVPALAANTTTYTIDEFGVSVNVPTSFIVFTRDIDENDPNLNLLGFDKSTLLNSMIEGDIYLDIISPNNDYSILISNQKMDLTEMMPNIEDYSDADLQIMYEQVEDALEDIGVICLSKEIYFSDNYKFIKIQSIDSNNYPCIQLMTFVNGKTTTFTMESFTGTLSQEMKNVLTQIVNSMEIESTPIIVYKRPTSYTNGDCGVSFTVRAGWGQYEQVVEQGYTKIKFVNEAGNTMLFGYKDIYSELPLDDQTMYSREDINCAYIDEDDLRSILTEDGSEISDINYRYFDHIKYFKVYLNKDTFINDTNTIMYIMVFHGTMYIFNFDGYEESTAYEDFVNLVASANYEEIITTNQFKNLMGIPANEEGFMLISALIVLSIAAVLLYMVPIIIYRYGIKKTPLAKKKAMKIMLIYGPCFCAIIIIFALAESSFRITALCAILWSFVNYAILKGGKAKTAPQNSFSAAGNAPKYYNPASPNTMYPIEPSLPFSPYVSAPPYTQSVMSSNAQYCRFCGAPLEPGRPFCGKCGSKMK